MRIMLVPVSISRLLQVASMKILLLLGLLFFFLLARSRNISPVTSGAIVDEGVRELVFAVDFAADLHRWLRPTDRIESWNLLQAASIKV